MIRCFAPRTKVRAGVRCSPLRAPASPGRSPIASTAPTSDGTVLRSPDGGDSWEAVGSVDGEPYKIEPVSGDELYIALSDGTIARTTDGGSSWEYVFRP